jgi:hypothetical protein
MRVHGVTRQLAAHEAPPLLVTPARGRAACTAAAALQRERAVRGRPLPLV